MQDIPGPVSHSRMGRPPLNVYSTNIRISVDVRQRIEAVLEPRRKDGRIHPRRDRARAGRARAEEADEEMTFMPVLPSVVWKTIKCAYFLSVCAYQPADIDNTLRRFRSANSDPIPAHDVFATH